MYCETVGATIDIPFLLDVANKKFNQGYKTMELMSGALSDQERFAVAVVVLLEVEEALRFGGMTEQEVRFIRKYHQLVQAFLDRTRGDAAADEPTANQSCVGPLPTLAAI